MKVALINPKGTIFSKNKTMSEFLKNSDTMGSFRHFWSAPCLGLLVIAAYLPDDWEVCYLDENLRNIDFSENYDFVCISTMTVQAERAYEISDAYRERNVLTVMGGIHATVMYQEALLHADIVLAGEGEVVFPAFLKDFQKCRTKRLYMEGTPGNFDMKDCIPPRYDLIKDYDYPLVNIYTTRGCPRKCNFCCASNVYGTKYRRKTNEEIVREVSMVTDMYPGKMILFADDNLAVLKSQSKRLFEHLKEFDVRWIAQADITIANDEELLQLLWESGCQWVVIGFESVSQSSLKNVESESFKYKYQMEYKSKIAKIQSYGIRVYGTFIVGLDGDFESIFDETAGFILDCNLYGANITVPTPLPGTRMREEMERQNRILSNNWGEYTLWDVVARPLNMSISQLEEGLLSIYLQLNRKKNADDRLKELWRGMNTRRLKGN